MVEIAISKPNFQRNLQHSFSLDERRQSKLDSHDSGMSSMQEPLASLSLESEQVENKSIQYNDDKFNRTSKLIYERSKSTGSVRKHDYNLQIIKDGTIANAKDITSIYRNFCIPKSANVSKSPLKFHGKTDPNTTEYQQSMSHQKREKKPFYDY